MTTVHDTVMTEAGGATPPATVKVWDPFVRVFHWSLVALFAIAYATGDEIERVHIMAGYAIAGLLALRSGSGPSALCQFARAFHAFRRMGELSGCAQAALSLGQAWQAGGDWRRARSAFLYAARLFLKLGARQDAHFAEARAAECRRLEAAWCWDPRRN